ncbi:TPA: MaoC family dehydratase N-terminal domain-containing protein [Pseudomonas putida]|uniref:FAS1-like dehydratase domain-containing protein n=1 Tax=Pseudomonas TaxID=286 RepID=UPI00104562C1|nr:MULTISPECIES: MaoC family dehydratase N-terminal domain-containing protein [Pseudomonas]MCS4062164.1 itaconyl-CoA hydratase/mesaconyl-C4 CoA hydratase [Pseudomonas putida]MDD1991446.1 MaoC family dehydratase N-terminal domain-containing protein [Pseudomonas putida]TCP74334.1 itaconyl-CoA hydratase/mesaconyl-C4 CoA hydratase [Pseudomonas putida]HDS0919567.1 MaoC family dehydratase N-terminal domain-containing protein [Pseudomonas putida]HDS0934924.1 MaoC family dehydratase N-terminal domain-
MTPSAPETWIGRSQTVHDCISHNLVKRIAATLSEPAPAPGAPLPELWHWAFFQDAVEHSGLGGDGHPARGGFLPPADNRNRMWAGGRLEFIHPLRVDAQVSRRSTILNVQEKHGRTGSLLFVTVQHEYVQDGQRALIEEQDIVYREPSPPKLGGTEPMPQGDWHLHVQPSPTLLFRYSAVTFNGHRIHYDWPYVTETEGYPGLVVHGPLIATLNVQAFVRANPQLTVRRFSFRGVRPLICPDAFEVGGRLIGEGKAQVWAGNQAGQAQVGEIEFVQEARQ